MWCVLVRGHGVNVRGHGVLGEEKHVLKCKFLKLLDFYIYVVIGCRSGGHGVCQGSWGYMPGNLFLNVKVLKK